MRSSTVDEQGFLYEADGIQAGFREHLQRLSQVVPASGGSFDKALADGGFLEVIRAEVMADYRPAAEFKFSPRELSGDERTIYAGRFLASASDMRKVYRLMIARSDDPQKFNLLSLTHDPGSVVEVYPRTAPGRADSLADSYVVIGDRALLNIVPLLPSVPSEKITVIFPAGNYDVFPYQFDAILAMLQTAIDATDDAVRIEAAIGAAGLVVAYKEIASLAYDYGIIDSSIMTTVHKLFNVMSESANRLMESGDPAVKKEEQLEFAGHRLRAYTIASWDSRNSIGRTAVAMRMILDLRTSQKNDLELLQAIKDSKSEVMDPEAKKQVELLENTLETSSKNSFGYLNSFFEKNVEIMPILFQSYAASEMQYRSALDTLQFYIDEKRAGRIPVIAEGLKGLGVAGEPKGAFARMGERLKKGILDILAKRLPAIATIMKAAEGKEAEMKAINKYARSLHVEILTDRAAKIFTIDQRISKEPYTKLLTEKEAYKEGKEALELQAGQFPKAIMDNAKWKDTSLHEVIIEDRRLLENSLEAMGKLSAISVATIEGGKLKFDESTPLGKMFISVAGLKSSLSIGDIRSRENLSKMGEFDRLTVPDVKGEEFIHVKSIFRVGVEMSIMTMSKNFYVNEFLKDPKSKTIVWKLAQLGEKDVLNILTPEEYKSIPKSVITWLSGLNGGGAIAQDAPHKPLTDPKARAFLSAIHEIMHEGDLAVMERDAAGLKAAQAGPAAIDATADAIAKTTSQADILRDATGIADGSKARVNEQEKYNPEDRASIDKLREMARQKIEAAKAEGVRKEAPEVVFDEDALFIKTAADTAAEAAKLAKAAEIESLIRQLQLSWGSERHFGQVLELLRKDIKDVKDSPEGKSAAAIAKIRQVEEKLDQIEKMRREELLIVRPYTPENLEHLNTKSAEAQVLIKEARDLRDTLARMTEKGWWGKKYDSIKKWKDLAKGETADASFFSKTFLHSYFLSFKQAPIKTLIATAAFSYFLLTPVVTILSSAITRIFGDKEAQIKGIDDVQAEIDKSNAELLKFKGDEEKIRLIEKQKAEAKAKLKKLQDEARPLLDRVADYAIPIMAVGLLGPPLIKVLPEFFKFLGGIVGAIGGRPAAERKGPGRPPKAPAILPPLFAKRGRGRPPKKTVKIKMVRPKGWPKGIKFT